MRKKVLLIIGILLISTFALLQLKFAFQMKLVTMVIKTKVERTIESFGNKVEETVTGNEAPVEGQPGAENGDASGTVTAGTTTGTNNNVPTNGGKAIPGVTKPAEKSIEATLEAVKNSPVKSDLKNQQKMTLSEKQIAKKYTPAFEQLRNSFISRMEGLIGRAKAEYIALPAEERPKQKLSLGFKYMELGEAMEKECDGQFNETLRQMKAELKKNQCDVALADTAKMEYEQQKYALKQALIDKIMK